MTKICFLLGSHWDYRMGGSELQAKLLVEALRRKKEFRVFYIYAGEKNTVFKKSCVVYCVLPRRKRLHKLGQPFFLDFLKIQRKLKAIQPDVIYQRVGSALTGAAAYYSRKRKCRMIWHISLERELIPEKFKSSPSFLFPWINKKFLEYGIRHADQIIGQAEYQDELLRKNYLRKCDRIVPNFHPLPDEEIRKTPPIKVVWVSNFKRFKRPELFVRLAEKFKAQKGVEFLMAGRGYGHRALRKQIQKHFSGSGHLKYLGEKSLESVNEILSRSHVLVNTSQYEGFPNVFIQAWMRKVPVLSLSVDPDQVLEKQKIGFCSGTFGNLVKDLKKLIKNKEQRQEMGERAQKYAFERHGLEGNRDRVVELFAGR